MRKTLLCVLVTSLVPAVYAGDGREGKSLAEIYSMCRSRPAQDQADIQQISITCNYTKQKLVEVGQQKEFETLFTQDSGSIEHSTDKYNLSGKTESLSDQNSERVVVRACPIYKRADISVSVDANFSCAELVGAMQGLRDDGLAPNKDNLCAEISSAKLAGVVVGATKAGDVVEVEQGKDGPVQTATPGVTISTCGVPVNFCLGQAAPPQEVECSSGQTEDYK